MRFNLGWWIQTLLPWGIGLGLLMAGFLLIVRYFAIPMATVFAAGGVAFFIIALATFYKARSKFMRVQDALVAIESDLCMHNALTAASHGLQDWPEFPPAARLGLRWNLKTAGFQVLGVATALLAAALIPLPAKLPPRQVAGQPAAWDAMKQRLEEVKTAEIVEPKALEELEAALNALQAKPENDWFSHESLETTDHLQESTEAALTQLAKNLESALAAMDVSRQLESAQMAALSPELNKISTEALKALASGTMPLNEKMLSDLKALDPSTLRQLSADEWEKIKSKMMQGISTCSNGFSSGDKAGDSLLAAVLASQGGVSRGPGSAPLALKDSETNLKTQSMERLENPDLSRAALGDLVGMGTGEHKVDESTSGAAGTLANPSSAGDSGSTMNASPSEQKILQKFFR